MADEPKRHRIEVACPECGNMQTEPALVVSTQCRSCRANFKVIDGKGQVRTLPVTRFAKPRKDGDPYPPPAALEKIKPPLRVEPSPPAPRSFLKRWLQPLSPAREILCFNCGHLFKAIAEAQSSQCPKCCGYISLLDYDITETWNRRIETRGNVVIRKTGTVSGTTMRCHNLTVLGTLAGSVECSGDLTIRNHGKINGSVKCRHLIVEKGAHVEFLNPVNATTAIIGGQVRGQIFCTGTVTLEKRAQLHGLVRTTSLIIKPGAKHTGTIEVITPPTPT